MTSFSTWRGWDCSVRATCCYLLAKEIQQDNFCIQEAATGKKTSNRTVYHRFVRLSFVWGCCESTQNHYFPSAASAYQVTPFLGFLGGTPPVALRTLDGGSSSSSRGVGSPPSNQRCILLSSFLLSRSILSLQPSLSKFAGQPYSR